MRAEIPETYKVPLVGSSSNSCMATAPPTRGPYLNINTQLANSLGTSPHSPAYMPGTPAYTPSMARSVTLFYPLLFIKTCYHQQAKLSVAAAGNFGNVFASSTSTTVDASWRTRRPSTQPPIPSRLCHACPSKHEQAPTAGIHIVNTIAFAVTQLFSIIK